MQWAWTQLYPKLATDVEVSIRGQAHAIQQVFFSRLKKSATKYLKHIIAPWLAGMFDSDRAVAAAALASIQAVFPDSSRQEQLWKFFMTQILTFAKDVVHNEDPSTLSDLRFTSQDEAYAKYNRVLSSALKLVDRALRLEKDYVIENPLLLTELLEGSKLWEACTSADAQVARAALQLITLISRDHGSLMDFHRKEVTKFIFGKNLKHCHEAVRLEMTQALVQFSTMQFPDIWNSSKCLDKGYLQLYLKGGSGRSGKLYWALLGPLIKALPEQYSPLKVVASDISAQSLSNSLTVVNAIFSGVQVEMTSYHQVPRLSTMLAAWDAYLSMLAACSSTIVELSDFFTSIYEAIVKCSNRRVRQMCHDAEFVTSLAINMAPLVEKVVHSEKASESLNKQLSDLRNCSDSASKRTYFKLLKEVVSLIEGISLEWLCDVFEHHLQRLLATETVLPIEDLVLVNQLLEILPAGHIPMELIAGMMKRSIVSFGGDTHLTRAILDITITVAHCSGLDHKSITDLLSEFYREAFGFASNENFAILLETASHVKPFVSPSSAVSNRLQNSTALFQDPNQTQCLAAGICAHDVFVFDEVCVNLFIDLCKRILDDSGDYDHLQQAFLYVCEHDRIYFEKVCFATQEGKQLILRAWQRGRDESMPYYQLLSAMKSLGIASFHRNGTIEPNKLQTSIFHDLKSKIDFGEIGELDLLVDQVQRLIDEETADDDRFGVFRDFLCKFIPWDDVILSICRHPVSCNLALDDCLGHGAVFLLESEVDSEAWRFSGQQIISYGLFSLALYANNISLAPQMSATEKGQLLKNLSIVSDFACAYNQGNTNCDFQDSVMTWETASALTRDTVNLINDDTAAATLHWILSSDLLSVCLTQCTRTSLYYGLTVSRVINLQSSRQKCEELANIHKNHLRKGGLGCVAFYSRAFAVGLEEPSYTWLVNHHSSEIAGYRPTSADGDRKILQNLVNLNILLQIPGSKANTTIPPNRLAMMIKSLQNWCSTSQIAYTANFMGPLVECLRFFSLILQSDGESKVSHTDMWSSMFDVFEQAQSVTSEIHRAQGNAAPLVFFMLGFFNDCCKFIRDDSEWDLKKKTISVNLLDIFIEADKYVCPSTTSTFGKMLITSSKLLDVDFSEKILVELYGALDVCKTKWVKYAVFNVCLKLIDEQMKENVLNFHLAWNTEQGSRHHSLPPELLGIVRASPLADEKEFQSNECSESVRFLLAWRLILCHFHGVSRDLRVIYSNQLRDNEAVDLALEFIGTLDLTTGFQDMCNGDDDDVARIDREGAHVLYGILQYIGSSARSWYSNVKRKALAQMIGKVAQTNLSPKLIAEELSKIENLESHSNGNRGTEGFSVRTFRPQHEVRAYYTKDGQTMELVIRFPPAFPLKDLEIDGVRRIGVKEKQWRAWILASQAIACSSGGDACDAIELLKRNISLHFEGTEECAICYSILHEDHTLPNKTCGTCHKKFHTDCLYKWFKTAGNQSCPLCRTTLSFRSGPE